MKVKKSFNFKKQENIKILNDLYSNLKFPSAFSGLNTLLTQAKKYFTNIKIEDIKIFYKVKTRTRFINSHVKDSNNIAKFL